MAAAGNINATAFIPQIWDAAVHRTLEDNLVARKICRNYSNAVKNFGDTIHFGSLADPTVNTYSGSITYETMVSAETILTVDQQEYYAFKVSDVGAAMANVDVKGSQAERAAFQLKKAADTYLLGSTTYGSAAGGTVTDASCDSASIISDIGLAQQYLAEQNVPESEMWMVIPPWVQLKLKLAGIKFSINNGINGKGGMSWTNELGFDIYVTTNVANVGSAATPQSKCLAGSYGAIAYAEGLAKTRSMPLENSFDEAISGLHVYGKKVIRANELVLLDLTYTAETAI